MAMVSSLVRLAFVLSVVAGSQSAGSQVPLESQSVPQEATSTAPSPSTNKAEAAADVPSPDEEPPEGELAPAALKLDVSNTSPLIEELYLATRETKEKEILAHIERAKSLVDSADLKAVDKEGRTALHWAIFGSSYNVKPSVWSRMKRSRIC